MLRSVILIVTVLLPIAVVRSAPVLFGADGSTQPYTAINKALGGVGYEVPDCKHPSFGPHISQQHDSTLNRQVFAFHIHVNEDDDRCEKDDRQRNEVKTYASSPAYLKAQNGETVSYSWNFKLPAGFKVTQQFTHIHQIKFVDGNDAAPLYTFSTTGSTSNAVLKYVHTDDKGNVKTLVEKPLSSFVDVWIHVYERITFGTSGSVFIDVRRVSDGAQLMTYTGSNLDSWRTGTSFCRPKWGIYRSLTNKASLRDETVLYDRFCLAKGTADDCERSP